MMGKRVDYRGSIDDAWGPYLVVEEIETADGRRYNLAISDGTIVLRNVRATSFTLVPAGPKHHVLLPQERAQVVQSEFHRRFPPGTWMVRTHEHFQNLPRYIEDFIDRSRPVQGEYYLLMAEEFVGCVPYQERNRRINDLVIAGDDQSWMD